MCPICISIIMGFKYHCIIIVSSCNTQVPLVDNSVGKKTLLLKINQSMQVENYLNYVPKDDQINKNWTSHWNYIGPRGLLLLSKRSSSERSENRHPFISSIRHPGQNSCMTLRSPQMLWTLKIWLPRAHHAANKKEPSWPNDTSRATMAKDRRG